MEVDTYLPSVSHFRKTLKNDNGLDDQIKEILKCVKKNWPSENLVRTKYDGTSNTSYGYHEADNTNDIVIFRIYGDKSELLIDRELELKSFQLLSTNQLASDIICTFDNGYCYQFISGESISMHDLTRPEILQKTACLVARIHAIKTPSLFVEDCKRVGMVFEHIERYLGLLSSNHFELNKERYFGMRISVEVLRHQISILKKAVEQYGGENVEKTFCHNDINCANLIYDKDTDNLSCIDYEYACVNYAPYDIGNFFCEFAGGFNMDFAKNYPTKETQLTWIRYYLEEKYRLLGDNQRNANDEEVNKLYGFVNLFALASHLLWCCWALVQSEISNIDFDFIAYAILRLKEYLGKKERFFALVQC